jgi:membrane-bound lytic murein transglycosylase D
MTCRPIDLKSILRQRYQSSAIPNFSPTCYCEKAVICATVAGMTSLANAPALKLMVESGALSGSEFVFSDRFTIGRHADCGLQLDDTVVSRRHAEVFFAEDRWWIKDLQSANGVFVNGRRIEQADLFGDGRIQLGAAGPQLFYHSAPPPAPDPPEAMPEAAAEHPPAATHQKIQSASKGKPSSDDSTSLRHYQEHYFGNTDDQGAGEHTIMVRRAFAQVQRKQRRLYGLIIGMVVLLLIGTGAFALIKHRQVLKQRSLAAEVFYSMRALEIDLMKLRLETQQSRSVEAKIQYDAVKTQQQKLEKSYDQYVKSLGVYGKGLSEKEEIILRMARRFGECEINMPKGFSAEVSDFIENWQSSQRLAKVIRKARRKGYIAPIVKALTEQELPPQFFYLAVQESNLDHRAVGPPTRFGIAKGMWQFIPKTAERYGLRTGPLKAEAEVDLLDERHDIAKSTRAAARYLRDIYTTDAQASGLLVMASYNWGEHRVVDLIRTMPANPGERNFWQLIGKYRERVPNETYDYVFSIFSAAVIGENPKLFGFDFDNPLPPVQ